MEADILIKVISYFISAITTKRMFLQLCEKGRPSKCNIISSGINGWQM